MRNNIAWAASLAITDLVECGRGYTNWVAHQIEHAISGVFDVLHAEGLSVVHPGWSYYCCELDATRFVQLAQRVFGIQRNHRSDKEWGRSCIETYKKKYKSWGMPVTLGEIGVGKNSYDRIAEIVISDPDSSIKEKRTVFDVLDLCK